MNIRKCIWTSILLNDTCFCAERYMYRWEDFSFIKE